MGRKSDEHLFSTKQRVGISAGVLRRKRLFEKQRGFDAHFEVRDEIINLSVQWIVEVSLSDLRRQDVRKYKSRLTSDPLSWQGTESGRVQRVHRFIVEVIKIFHGRLPRQSVIEPLNLRPCPRGRKSWDRLF
ncbi:MAG: hypothetical protein EOO38_32545 [Cytophagaceae bacterium]|nr:MAG: hypothetical protein EOO38_32545 [Cytophagaceae bacterium]